MIIDGLKYLIWILLLVHDSADTSSSSSTVSSLPNLREINSIKDLFRLKFGKGFEEKGRPIQGLQVLLPDETSLLATTTNSPLRVSERILSTADHKFRENHNRIIKLDDVQSHESEPPRLLGEPIPFKFLTHHHNPTIYNFPSFSAILTPVPNALRQINRSRETPSDAPKIQAIGAQEPKNAVRSIAIEVPVFSQNIQPPAVSFQNESSTTEASPFQRVLNSFSAVSSSEQLSSEQPSLSAQLNEITSLPTFPPPPIFISDDYGETTEPGIQTTAFPLSSRPPIFSTNLSATSTEGQFTIGQIPPLSTQSPIGSDLFRSKQSPETFPFDPTFPGPAKPKRFQPKVGGSCISFTGERGLCLPLERCPALRPLVKQLHNKELLVVLLNNVCRFENGNIYFCCEFPAFQPGEVEFTDTSFPAFLRSSQAASLPDSDDCGKKLRLGKIIGGKASEANEWPWLAAIGRPETNKQFMADCAGSLITKRHVLTAASCFLFPEFFQSTHVRLGEHDHRRQDLRPHEDYIIVGRNEPGFLSPTTQNNLMILTLDRDVQFRDHIRPICLPGISSDDHLTDDYVTIVGWGLSQRPDEMVSGDRRPERDTIPRHIEQEVQSVSVCQEAYSKPSSSYRVIDHRNICIRRHGKEGVCIGDTGGPVMQRGAGGRYTLVGVVSTSAGCLDGTLPTLATKLGPYLPWVQHVLEGPE
ncbi:Serine proteases trypsin domain [Trinorchestia longiramus]|nr:Serine proteases trypsin domain [Trinorchestia longiramus]